MFPIPSAGLTLYLGGAILTERYPDSVCGDPSASAFTLQVHVNPSQSVLVLEGDDIESFNRAVQQVTYRNSLRFATPGVRPLKLTTSLRYYKRTHARTHAPMENADG